jgi:hypothetical protein
VVFFPAAMLANTDEVERAHFIVSNEVITPNLKPFTATIGAFGNGGRLTGANSGFEPMIFRTRYSATQNAPNRVFVNRSEISYYDSLRTGALDGAKVDIYRISNGAFNHVRSDKVPDGGFQVSGWFPVLKAGKVIAPNTSTFIFSWANWNRSNVPYYFSVRAIDKWGNLSDFATSIKIIKPKGAIHTTTKNDLIKFKPRFKISLLGNPETPQNLTSTLTAEGLLKLSWNASKKPVTGYLVFKSDTPPEKHKGFYLGLTNDGPAIKKGDMVIIHKKFYTGSRKKNHSNRVWYTRKEIRMTRHPLIPIFSDENPDQQWELLPHPSDTPVEQPGETYLRLTLRKADELELGHYNHSGSEQDWYIVLQPMEEYQIEVWMRSDQQQVVEFKASRIYGDRSKSKIKPIKFTTTNEWRKYTATFVPPIQYKGGKPQRMYLLIHGPGTIDIDNFRIFKSGTPFLEYTKAEKLLLRNSAMAALRTHGFIKTGSQAYDLTQLTNKAGVISSPKAYNTLPQVLSLNLSLGTQPWLQIEPHFSPDEWLGLVEYLAAEYNPEKDTQKSKPWAWKRFTQGRKAPWTSSFDQIYFEIGNETWNRLFRPWIFLPMTDAATGEKYSPGTVYGLYQEYILSVMRKSPYWAALEPRLKVVIGGWARSKTYGQDAARATPSSDFLTIAAYNGGWDEDEGPVRATPESYFNVLNQSTQSAKPSAQRYVSDVRNIQKNRERPLSAGTYEAGPGYVLNGLNGAKVTKEQAAEQEIVMKGLAAGTATLDAFLARAREGFTLQNYFTYSSGQYWSSRARWYNGGQSYPSWDLLALFNRIGTGNMLKVETVQVPTTKLNAFSRRKTIENAPLVDAYVTRKANRLTLFLVSRRVPNFPITGDSGQTFVSVDLPIKFASSITQYSLTGTYSSHNVFSKDVRIVSKDITGLGFLPVLKHANLPAGHTVIYVFDGIKN